MPQGQACTVTWTKSRHGKILGLSFRFPHIVLECFQGSTHSELLLYVRLECPALFVPIVQHRQTALIAELKIACACSVADQKFLGAWKSGKQRMLTTFPDPGLWKADHTYLPLCYSNSQAGSQAGTRDRTDHRQPHRAGRTALNKLPRVENLWMTAGC
jgi:hypothetical protein